MQLVVHGPEPQVHVGVVASYDFTRDRELWRWVPENVTLSLSRTSQVPTGDNFAVVSALSRPALLARPVREVCAIGAEVVVFACTACSFVGGAEAEAALREAMRGAGAPRALTTAGAMVRALRAVEAHRIAVVHPYEDRVGARLRDYLAEFGFDVVGCTALGVPVQEVAAASYADVVELVLSGDRADAEAVFVSCTALPTYDVIAPLEKHLGKPVITANQATVWAALRELGIAATGSHQTLIAA